MKIPYLRRKIRCLLQSVGGGLAVAVLGILEVFELVTCEQSQHLGDLYSRSCYGNALIQMLTSIGEVGRGDKYLWESVANDVFGVTKPAWAFVWINSGRAGTEFFSGKFWVGFVWVEIVLC